MNARSTDNGNIVIRYNSLQQGALTTIVIFLVVQAAGWIWWASSTSTTLSFLSEEMVQLKGSIGNYVQVKTQLEALTQQFRTVQEQGSPITQQRLTLLEYKMKELSGGK